MLIGERTLLITVLWIQPAAFALTTEMGARRR
jgi:hypothetical protein